MAILKCKMCGGDIALSEDRTCGTCEYCGSTMTFPKVSDEQRLNLFNRANHFRRQNEFDKAIAAYDRILDLDDADAEAHWGAVLSRYGIEYVEDPVTYERIPTCHRVQPGSILTDGDYLAALEHAPDAASRDLYEKEAKRIAEIQKGILAISAQEKPYDVFICYKETDEGGSRTVDSMLAQDIYYQLANDGYKVFFSRITLEDKLGREYEPYIFAALNSAKVMLVVGTRPENFSAVWVKNEWSRFLTLMKSDRNKLLIPCYRDMDPYDLPEELSALQSQDMAKIGFLQDLTRGIRKLLEKDVPKPQPVVQPTASQASSVAPLLKRAFIFLEDGDWSSADDYAERVLDADPENGRAYLVKLMARLKVRREGDLKHQPRPFDGDSDYQKILRFGDEALKKQLRDDIDHINDRNEHNRQKGIFDKAVEALAGANTVGQCLEVKRTLDSISGFEGVGEQMAACDAKIESIKAADYQRAVELQAAGKWQQAIEGFEALQGYRDSREKIAECEEGRETERRAEEERRERERREAEAKAKAEAAKRRARAIVACLLIAAVAVGVFAYVKVFRPSGIYNSAVAAMNAGKYDEATEVFESLGDYKDAATQALESQYQKAQAQYNEGDYVSAYQAYSSISGFKDVDNLLSTDDNLTTAAAYLTQFKVGNIVTFGCYEQDDDTTNGAEAIEWLVLAIDGETATLISKYALDCKPYNTEYTSITWETCTLRKWLNEDFLDTAFTAEEQEKLSTVTVTANKNPSYFTDAGNDTQDKVFLLSIDEVKHFFVSDSERMCMPTKMALSNGVNTSDTGACWWWLRSPGNDADCAAGVNYVGSVNYLGLIVHTGGEAIRPVVVLRFR